MTINQRIDTLIKELNITQTAFAKSVNVTQAYISKVIRTGNPSDLFINTVCMVHNISEEWLRYGKGNMYLPVTEEERYSKNIAKLQRADDETIMRWVNAIAETNPAALAEVESFMKRLLNIE